MTSYTVLDCGTDQALHSVEEIPMGTWVMIVSGVPLLHVDIPLLPLFLVSNLLLMYIWKSGHGRTAFHQLVSLR